ncbi:hypothetical protein RFI_08333 [Reticulomyxa filosa]|uniref:Sugar phosphate transporter domain-containing protein n=1 Tax=Reticulomyxa filosa TaxID=46433 RepID=X6NS82_RETFI|nr:hypothetical protein RFI_08333 [Reticulomyxa filosa]|eukprot:ETO28793.1 hypothetical protein RFI_08333 [Reticulomyxa filosa]
MLEYQDVTKSDVWNNKWKVGHLLGGYWISAMIGLALNWCEMRLVGEWNALPLYIITGVKLLLMIVCSWAVFNHKLTTNSLVGYVLCVLGVIAYNWSKVHMSITHPRDHSYAQSKNGSLFRAKWCKCNRTQKVWMKYVCFGTFYQIFQAMRQCCLQIRAWRENTTSHTDIALQTSYDKVYCNFPDTYWDSPDAIHLTHKKERQDKTEDSSDISVNIFIIKTVFFFIFVFCFFFFLSVFVLILHALSFLLCVKCGFENCFRWVVLYTLRKLRTHKNSVLIINNNNKLLTIQSVILQL